MSDYKRFISYIYEYAQGEKRESCGFVKVNARGEECKIWIHMKGFYMHGQAPYRVYILGREKGRLPGWFLGELENRNGALEWNITTKTDSLMDTRLRLEESCGLYIAGDNQVWAAEWDDYPVDVERFEAVRGSARQEVVEAPEAAAAEAEPEPAAEPVAEQNTESEYEGEPEPEKNPEVAYKEEAEAEPLRAAELETPVLQRGIDSRRSQWGYLLRHFPAMQYMDGEAVISSIRLNQKDLARVPRDKWGLGNNSFLFHGFYQYHHLLLLRRQTREMAQYFVGVPGVYNEREQLMASMFGFQEFKVMKNPDVKKGSFGYWCRLLE